MKDKFEILKNLENKCANLEDKLLTNVISDIAKKIDNVESKINSDEEKVEKIQDVKKENKLTELENVIKTIEAELNIIENKEKEKNIDVTDKINHKIEENYKVLKQIDEMEKPILSNNNYKKPMPKNSKIEEKIHEMNEKLQHLFLNNSKTVSKKNYVVNPDINIKNSNKGPKGKIFDAAHRNGKGSTIFQETITVSDENYNELIDTINNKFSLKKSNQQIQDKEFKNKKKQELINKLNETDIKIKALAGNIMRHL